MASPSALGLLGAFAEGAVAWSDHFSRSEIAITDRAVVFQGLVSLELRIYGGDCAAVESADARHDLSGFTGLAVRARGDGNCYVLRLCTSETFRDVRYEATLALEPGDFRDVLLPFACFQPVWDWQPFAGHPPLDPGDITTLGLAVAPTGREQRPFRLELASMEGYRAPPEAPAPRSSEAAVWEAWLEDVLLPLVIEAGLVPSADPREVFRAAATRRATSRIPCYAAAAEVVCEDLVVLAAARSAARHAATARSVWVREALVYLAMEAAHERAIAMDLVATTPAGCGVPGDFLEREHAADEAFERWRALDAPVAAALSRAGLALDDDG
jgi:hypothetical protein